MNIKLSILIVVAVAGQALGQGGSTTGSAPTTAPVVTDQQRLGLYSAQERVTAAVSKAQALPLWAEVQTKAQASDAAKKAFDETFAKLAVTPEYKDALAAQTAFKKAQDDVLGDTKKWKFGPGWVVEQVVEAQPTVKK